MVGPCKKDSHLLLSVVFDNFPPGEATNMAPDRWTAVRVFLFGLILFAVTLVPVRAADWPKIPPDELNLKDSPTHPGSHAISLYHEVQTDDVQSTVRYHTRIKILSEKGKKHANIELSYLKKLYTIEDIKARTVRPDGSSIEFKGEIFEKTIVKRRGVKFLAKTFSLPEVQVGTIIEYKYREQWDPQRFPARRWLIQQELPIRRALFTRKRYTEMAVQWISFRLPDNNAAKESSGVIRLELENIPPFEEEDFMPPEEELTMRVDFYYVRERKEPNEFWEEVGKQLNKAAEDFIGKHDDIAREAAAVVNPADPPETKLRKLYVRAQQVRNLSYERAKTEKEEKREKLKTNNNVKDVLKNGYATGWEINCFFVALARAAGFEASVAYLAGRHEYFFNLQYLDSDQLNAYVAVVSLNGQDIFLDPATKFAPYGLLSWAQTGVRGLKLNKKGGEFIRSPLPDSSFGLAERKAKLRLLDDGTLEGDLEVSYHGQAALSRRLSDYEEDDAGRRKAREDEIKEWLPDGATAEIRAVTGFDESEQPMRIECTIRVPGFAAATGRRILLPFSVFHVGRRNPFQNTRRIHPVYFRYPFREVDEVTISLPEDFQVEGLPAPREQISSAVTFRTESKSSRPGTLQIERRFAMEGILFPVELYPALREFYTRVRTADEEHIVLKATQTAQRWGCGRPAVRRLLVRIRPRSRGRRAGVAPRGSQHSHTQVQRRPGRGHFARRENHHGQRQRRDQNDLPTGLQDPPPPRPRVRTGGGLLRQRDPPCASDGLVHPRSGQGI